MRIEESLRVRYRKGMKEAAPSKKKISERKPPLPPQEGTAGTRRRGQALNPNVTERQSAPPLSFRSTRHRMLSH